MYINFETLKKNNLNIGDLEILIAIKQLEKQYIEENKEYIQNRLDSHLYSLNILSEIKGKKNEESIFKIRLNRKGRELLELLEEANILEEDKIVLDWLSKEYINRGKEIGNSKRTLRHIRDFRIKSEISKNNLVILCLDFLKDDNNMEYNHKLEYTFYKPPTLFQTKFNLEDSRLYRHYLKHKERIDKKFK